MITFSRVPNVAVPWVLVVKMRSPLASVNVHVSHYGTLWKPQDCRSGLHSPTPLTHGFDDSALGTSRTQNF